MKKVFHYNSIKNVKALDDHKIFLKTKFDRDTTRNNHYTYIDIMLRKIGKDFDKLNIKDIEAFFDGMKESSAEAFKPAIRLFLEKNGRKKLANLIERNAKVLSRCQKYDDKDILKKEKIEELINKPDLLMHRAILETFILYGIREDELIQLKKSDIKIDNLTVWVNVRFPKGRLKKRKIPIFPNEENPVARYPNNLVNWHRSLTNRHDDDYLFYSRQYHNRGGKLSASGLRALIKGYGKDVGVERLCPHLFRHTGATYDVEFYNPQDMCQKYG
jgi:integrase